MTEKQEADARKERNAIHRDLAIRAMEDPSKVEIDGKKLTDIHTEEQGKELAEHKETEKALLENKRARSYGNKTVSVGPDDEISGSKPVTEIFEPASAEKAEKETKPQEKQTFTGNATKNVNVDAIKS